MSLKDPLGGLGSARVALGCVFLLRTTPLLAAFHVSFLADARPLLGWPDGHAHFAPFIPALPAALLAVLCVVRTLAAVAFTVGIRARVAGFVAGGLGYLTVLQDPARFYTTHHVIFLGAILLASTDAVSVCAVSPEPRRSPNSSLLLIRAWVASIYIWAAIAKVRPDWLDGRTFVLLARGASCGLLSQPPSSRRRRSEPSWRVVPWRWSSRLRSCCSFADLDGSGWRWLSCFISGSNGRRLPIFSVGR